MSRTGDLLLLQELDGRREREEARLARLEDAIARDPELEQLRRLTRRAQKVRLAVEAELATQEGVVAGLQARARELQRHLYDGSIRNPQELLSMQHDLDDVRGRLSAEEDRELEIMERAEAAVAEERAAAEAAEGRLRQRSEGADAVEAEAADLRASLAVVAADRATLLTGLAPADVARYERVRARLHPAVVTLVGDSCGGCHIPFGNSEIRRVRAADTPVQCANCDRIVVS